jgi:hypothetical protein
MEAAFFRARLPCGGERKERGASLQRRARVFAARSAAIGHMPAAVKLRPRRSAVPVGNLIRLVREAESRKASVS